LDLLYKGKVIFSTKVGVTWRGAQQAEIRIFCSLFFFKLLVQ